MDHIEFAKNLSITLQHSVTLCKEHDIDGELTPEHLARLKSVLFLAIFGYLMHTEAVSNYGDGEGSYVELCKLCNDLDFIDDSSTLIESGIVSILTKFEEDASGTSNYAYDPIRIPILT